LFQKPIARILARPAQQATCKVTAHSDFLVGAGMEPP